MATCAHPGCSMKPRASSNRCLWHHAEIDKRQAYVVDLLKAHLDKTILCVGFLCAASSGPTRLANADCSECRPA